MMPGRDKGSSGAQVEELDVLLTGFGAAATRHA